MRCFIGWCRLAPAVWGVLIALSTPGVAQDFRTWLGYNGDHKIKDTRFSLLLETQYRVIELDEQSGQFLFRPGLQYQVNEWLRVGGGYAFQLSDPGKGQSALPEHRAWEQLVLRHRPGGLQLTQRVRLEQRWIGVNTPDKHYEYHNRVRYAARVVIPLTKSPAREYYMAVHNELFINFGKGTRNVYDQNRSGVSLGYHVGAIGNIEVGYLLQAQNSPSHVMSYHNILYVALVSNFPFGKR